MATTQHYRRTQFAIPTDAAATKRKRCAFVLALLVSVFAPPGFAAGPAVGDLAPEFALAGSDGKTHRLADYRGRLVVLAWFPKAFTGG